MSAIIRRMIPAANLTLLYGQLPLEARFEAAARDGFRAVEILYPYDRSPAWYAARLREFELELALINTPVDADAAPVGRAAQCGETENFRNDFALAAAVCEATGCRAVHVMAGPARPSATSAALIENLSWATQAHPQLTLQLEALNAHDMPGYFYCEPAAVRRILEEARLPNVGMQFDFFHVVRQGLDLCAELKASLPWIRHVQVAGSPARNEPDLSRDHLLAGFEYLHRAGYRGYVGYEYRPAAAAADGLKWADELFTFFSYQWAGKVPRNLDHS